ncbi:MAG: cytochrome c-type biogenesis CcmF C-terminal domain-containing protein, partial [Pseudomonadota bacterium]
ELGEMRPERRFYPAAGSSTTEVALRRGVLGDLYVVLGEARAGGARVMEARYFPLINFIYLGAALISLGGALALTGRRVGIRRTRTSPVPPAAQPAE